jgi:hypothetical protein
MQDASFGGRSPEMKKYRITLEAEEREQLRAMLSKGKADVRRLKHAQILLAADESDGAPSQIDTSIAKALLVMDQLNIHSAASCMRPFRLKRPSASLKGWRFIKRPSTAVG